MRGIAPEASKADVRSLIICCERGTLAFAGIDEDETDSLDLAAIREMEIERVLAEICSIAPRDRSVFAQAIRSDVKFLVKNRFC